MTGKELKDTMLKKDGTRVLAIFDENTKMLSPTVRTTQIEDITLNELYFNYGILKASETLYHFLNHHGAIYFREANTTSDWREARL